jgi:hypothetical protein
MPHFPLSAPTLLPAPEANIPGAPAPGPVTLTPVEQPLTQQALLSVFSRVLDSSYLLPLIQPGPGYEVLQAYAAMWERVSQSAVNSLNVFTLSSQGGQLATGFVTFSRDSTDVGIETIKAGTLITTSNGNRVFVTLDDATFTATGTVAVDVATSSTSIPVQALVADWQWNVPGNTVTASGGIIPGDIDTILLPLVYCGSGVTNVAISSTGVDISTFIGSQALNVISTAGFSASGVISVVTSTGAWPVTYSSISPMAFNGCNSNGAEGVMAFGNVVTAVPQILYDPSISVTNSAPTTGGRPPILDQIAMDQGLTRQSGESDISLAQRIRTLPNTITPADILLAAQNALAPYMEIPGLLMQEPLGIGALPSPTGYSGVLVGFMDADPAPIAGVASPEAIGLWYMDQPGAVWQAATSYYGGVAVHPTASYLTGNTNVFVVIGAGVSGKLEPNWPTVLGDTILDGSVIWQLQKVGVPVVGPGLNQVVPVGSTVTLGVLGPSDESDSTSRAFFRLRIPWIGDINPGLAFSYFGGDMQNLPWPWPTNPPSTGVDYLYPTQGSYSNGNIPAGDYPYAIPGVGFMDSASYAGDPQNGVYPATPTSFVAGQIYNNAIQMVAAGVGLEVTAGP